MSDEIPTFTPKTTTGELRCLQYDLPLQTSSVRVKSISTTEVSQVSDMQQAISRLEESRLAHAHARKERTYVRSAETRTFLSSSYLEHINAHTEDKLCNCIMCNKSFVYKRSLKKHKMIHP